MGGAVSSGEDNNALVDNLIEAEYIKSQSVEKVFRMVDRGFYYTKIYKSSAYKDMAWKDGNLHLSAPCIYSKVMENLHLKAGHAFLNIGSGTGYLSSMVGCMIGKTGVNHGIELHRDVVEYSRAKLESFLRCSPAVDVFEFCAPKFVVGNCLDINGSSNHRYDRIYCGAACPENYLQIIIDLLKIGGLCIVPVNDSLVQITRVSESRVEMKNLLPVSFASLYMEPNPVPQAKEPVQLPELNPSSLAELCREQIRSILRQSLKPPEFKSTEQDTRKRLRNRRARRRKRNRLLVVQRRRNNGSSEGETNGRNGYISITYSARRGNTTTSDDDDNRHERRVNTSRRYQSQREDRRQSFTKSKKEIKTKAKSLKSNENTKIKKGSTGTATTSTNTNGTNSIKKGENGEIDKNQSDDSMDTQQSQAGCSSGPRDETLFDENIDFSDDDDDDDDDDNNDDKGGSGQNLCDLPLTKEDFEKLPKNHGPGRRTRNTLTIMRSSLPFSASERNRFGSSSSTTTQNNMQSSQSQSSTRAERGSTSSSTRSYIDSQTNNNNLEEMGAAVSARAESLLTRIRDFVRNQHMGARRDMTEQQRAETAAENYAERLAEVDSSDEEELPDLEEPDTPATWKNVPKSNVSTSQKRIISIRPLPPKVYQLSSSPSSSSSSDDSDGEDKPSKNRQKKKSPSPPANEKEKEKFTFDSSSNSSSSESDDDFELPDIDEPNSHQMRCPMGHRLRFRQQQDDPMEEDEETETCDEKAKPIPIPEEDIPITNTFSLELMEKIKLLPLPPALKIYVNYNRKLN